MLESFYQAIQGDNPHQCITAWIVDEKMIASIIMWWEPLQRVSQSSHGKISSSGSCLPGITTCYPRHRLLPNVWDDAMFIPTTDFCLMCAMTRFSPPRQALTVVWDEAMLTPQGARNGVRLIRQEPLIKEIGFRWDQEPTTRHYLSWCLAPRVANWDCRLSVDPLWRHCRPWQSCLPWRC